VIYEDDDILVIDKPYGMVVNRAESVRGETVADWVEKNYDFWKKGGEVFRNRSGIIHRIDKETSGLLLIAKNEKTFCAISEQFARREVKKRYLALVHGRIKEKKGTIEVGIRRNPQNRRRFMACLSEGKRAKTKYQVRRYYLGQNREVLTLVEVFPVSGRTHQIRVHFKFINHSLVSDLIYGGRKTLRRDQMICPRLFLHAGYLVFSQPKTGKMLELFCQIPADLKTVLEKLKKID